MAGEPRLAALALTVPGLGVVLQREARRAGLHVSSVENDGRADVVKIAGAATAIGSLRTAEVVCLDLGSIALARTPHATAAALDVRTLASARRLRLVVRMQRETTFTRTALRSAIERRLRGRVDEGGDQELWVIQTGGSRLRVGLRVHEWARRPERVRERPGALRPAAAAAMVQLAGRHGRLLDPCCGTATIIDAALQHGWTASGGDNDAAAMLAARANVPVPLTRLDARRLPFVRGAFDAVVTNLPFGHQHRVQGVPAAWYRRVLAEALRVAPVAVVLSPASTPFRQALGRLPVTLEQRVDITLLGRPTTIWVIRRGRA